MTEISIAIIKINDFEFLKDKYYLNQQNITKDISQFIEIKKILFSDLMETIVDEIKLTPELIGESPVCYETKNNVYQICFVSTENNNDLLNTINVNKFCSYLIGEKVFGTCVFINSKISQNNTCLPDNIDLNIISTIIYQKFVHKGIFLSFNDKEPVQEFDYFNHPLEYYKFNEKEYENFKMIEISFLKFNISAFIEIKSSNGINKRATKILGTQKVNGNVIFIIKSTNEFNDFSKEIYDKIFILASDSINSRKLKEHENTEDIKKNGLPIVFNQYCILEKKFNSFEESCDHCKKKIIDNNLICSGCYRAKYDCSTCQKNNWEYHKKECLYKNDPINK